MLTHEKVKLHTSKYGTVDAIAPVILSASRATDIPAFHHKWFLDKLEKGYSVWVNPYNSKPQFVSYQNVKGIVFWSKNPDVDANYDIISHLNDKKIEFYYQYTLNNYEKEGFELGLPPIDRRIDNFIRLSQFVGRSRVIWRFDPLILTKNLTVDELVKRVEDIGDCLKGYTNKLVFSFVDINAYKKVKRNLVNETQLFTNDTIDGAEFTIEEMKEMASKLAQLRDDWKSAGWDLELATCGEAFDLDQYGISHNRCVDAELFKKLTKDEEFIKYLDKYTLTQFKDGGQRPLCGCMLSKDIGQYNTCQHFCTYCYANTSKYEVNKNCKYLSKTSDSLLPFQI